MKRTLMAVLVLMLAAGCGGKGRHLGSEPDSLGPYASRAAFVEAVECGEAGADDFIRAIRKGPLRLEEVTPEAVANYLEALAFVRMLDRVPARYTASREMILSYDIVFEDSRNVFHNWEAFKAYLQRVYKADLG